MAKPKIPAIVALALLLSLLGSFTFNPVVAGAEEARWSRVNIPTEGPTGNWVLASGSDVRQLTMAADGTLYAYANPTGISATLFKSGDGGYGWSATGQVTDNIVGIATAPDNASIIYYATATNVYKSADGGSTFSPLPPQPGGAGSNNIEITAIAAGWWGSSRIIAAATRDSDNAQFGGVYLLDESRIVPSWVNSNIGNRDVLALAFSPKSATDGQMVAVATDEQDTLITVRVGNSAWSQIIGQATIKSVVARAAALAFPEDYDASGNGATLFAGIDTGSGQGDVYRIKTRQAPDSSTATDLNAGAGYNLSSVDVSGLAVSGNTMTANLLAGAASNTQVYLSTDGGHNWERSQKEPTGQAKTGLLVAPDFATSHRAYAVTTGSDSAFSSTMDGGITWNQISLVDTTMTDLRDLAASPNYSADNALFLLTWGGKYSLWRSRDGGEKWERVFSSSRPNIDSVNLVKLPPNYGSGSQVVFLAGTGGGNPAIWKSTNNGQTFSQRIAPLAIDTWAAVDDNTLFLGSYNGSSGLVYSSNNSGFFYSAAVAVGSQPLKSIVLSPGYQRDKTVLVGNSNGWVYWSSDNGTSFELLGQQLPLSGGVGNISVAFDPKFSSNKTVYATSDAQTTSGSKERLFRWVIGKSQTWESIDSTLPVGSMLNQLVMSASGTLYASNSQSVDTTKKEGGLERSLNPTYSLGPVFETVTRGLENGATLIGLWLQTESSVRGLTGNQLWSFDTTNTRLVTYIDSLAQPVTLVSPLDQSAGLGTRGINLDWAGLKGATKYQWQLDYNTDFATIPAELQGETEGSSVHLPVLEMGTTYYWRVRATSPVLSHWSAKWSFTTSLGAAVVAPELLSPEAAASGSPLKPIFQWSAIAGAESYELLVSSEVSFANPIIVRIDDYALPATAWQSDASLEYNTTYYWKVRAKGANSYSAWSAVSAFTTQLPPAPPSPIPEPQKPLSVQSPPSPPPPPSSPSSAQSAFPDWAIYLGVTLLLMIVFLLIAVVALLVGARRY